MSLAFNDGSGKSLVDQYEEECGFTAGEVSGNTTKLKKFAAAANIALDKFTEIAVKASGKYQWDDSNHTDFPIISTDLISGQRDYSVSVDEDGNYVLDIFRVFVADRTGTFHEVFPVDAQTESDTTAFTDGQNASGVPTRYDKFGNSLFFDFVPNYNMRFVQEGIAGVKMYVNREGSYFSYGDTTKKPGVPGLFHDYFFLRPAREYARRNKLANFAELDAEVKRLEGVPGVSLGAIGEYFAYRDRHARNRITPGRDSNR